MKELLLPYYNNRKGRKIDTIVIHASAQHTADELIAKLEERKLSSHFLIDEEGELTNLVPEACRAWHAGVGYWNGESDLNSTSIGIEMCNGLFGEEPFSEKQMDALIKLCHYLMIKYDILPTQVIGHSDLAPTRKIDPGSMFPWKKMAENGIGVWYDNKNIEHGVIYNNKYMLEKIGYATDDLEATEWAFCRHYNPELYYFMGGKKGANKGTIEGVVLHDNPEYIKTLKAVYMAFKNARDEFKIKELLINNNLNNKFMIANVRC